MPCTESFFRGHIWARHQDRIYSLEKKNKAVHFRQKENSYKDIRGKGMAKRRVTESEAGEVSALVDSGMGSHLGRTTLDWLSDCPQVMLKLKSWRSLPHDFCVSGDQMLISDYLAPDEVSEQSQLTALLGEDHLPGQLYVVGYKHQFLTTWLYPYDSPLDGY